MSDDEDDDYSSNRRSSVSGNGDDDDFADDVHNPSMFNPNLHTATSDQVGRKYSGRFESELRMKSIWSRRELFFVLMKSSAVAL